DRAQGIFDHRAGRAGDDGFHFLQHGHLLCFVAILFSQSLPSVKNFKGTFENKSGGTAQCLDFATQH
ncbi:hypothetical protein, partial [Gemmobacter sp.]|uniref:hypothetical protein n=1 Tax=Gemmobacter sp. TaxID=1898957 RepID=UPI0025C5B262